MNLLSQFNQIFPAQERAFATITGQRGGGTVVALTTGGATILLKGEMETGKNCWYDRRSASIISEAPDVEFSEFPV